MLAVLTGLLTGTLHVWSGPDHLAAIAPLAVRGRARSWIAGVRWGLGHSAGVGAVGVASLWLREQLPIAALSVWGERLVGIMLVAIGLWGLQRALRARLHTHRHAHDDDEGEHVHPHLHARRLAHEEPVPHVHIHAAFGIGTLHGLAGSSHLLGVLPALAFPTTAQAATYLVAFGVGTITSMTAFAYLMGLVATRPAFDGGRVSRGLMACAAAAALIVGCAWLVV
jgi:sulfite exporter TauE/SafE